MKSAAELITSSAPEGEPMKPHRPKEKARVDVDIGSGWSNEGPAPRSCPECGYIGPTSGFPIAPPPVETEMGPHE